MTPTEIAALLRIKQVRESRARAALDAARRRQSGAATRRDAALGAEQAFAAEAEQKQRAAFATMDGTATVSANELNAVAARLGDLRTEATRLRRQAREATVTEQRLVTQAEAAASAHGVAMRGAEAFEALRTELMRDAAAKSDRTEEAETEEPRPTPRSTPRQGA